MAEKVLDVVCGMMVDPDTAPAATTYHREAYYFCGPPRQVAFEEHPEQFIDEGAEWRRHVAERQRQSDDNT